MLTLARSVSERGELTLLRRPDGALELRVNGLFAMDTAETSSERLLASATIDATVRDRSDAGTSLRVLVGGLGLGFTVAALLDDPRIERVVVVEIEADLVRWHRSGVVPHPRAESSGPNGALLDDPRLEVVVGDVRGVVAEQPRSAYDVMLLDVDNGPGFLLYDANAAIYREPFLRECADGLRPDGAVAIWSASEATGLAAAMGAVFATTDVRAVPVTLNDRRTHYHLYVGHTANEDGARRAG
jgi:spermidine synthase